MENNMIQAVPWIASVTCIYFVYDLRKKKANTWLIGIVLTFLRLFFFATTKQYGFLLAEVVMIFIYTKNYYEWRRDEIFKQKQKEVLIANTKYLQGKIQEI